MEQLTNQDISQALSALRPEAAFVVRGDTLDGIEWLDGNQTKPSNDEIANKIVLLKNNSDLSIDEKLGSVGLSINDLKVALGIG